MRRIEIREERERREKRRNKMLTLFMLGILVISTLGFAFLNSSENTDNTSDNVNNTQEKVRNVGDKWIINFRGQELTLSSSPESIKEIPVNISLDINNYNGKPLYIASESESMYYEIGSTIGKYAEKTHYACYGKCEKNLPEKNCTDNLIVWNQTDENKVYQQENCVFIEGDIRAVDAFLYKILDVI